MMFYSKILPINASTLPILLALPRTVWKRSKCGNFSKVCNKLRMISIFAQELIGIDRVKKYGVYENIVVGSNWFSITDSLARYVVSKEQEILKCYKNTYC